MLFNQITYLGIDPTAGQRRFTYAALDHELRLLALGSGVIETTLAYIAGQSQARISVNAPLSPNQGLLKQDAVRQQLSPIPLPGRWTNFRVAEVLLRQRGITIPRTAAQENDCPHWMQMGFAFYRRLRALGCIPYPASETQSQFMEVNPHACYTVILGQIPLPKHFLEGRLQRQLTLYEHGLNIPDPMRFFEEITRHHLLKGILPLDQLYSSRELDALMAAYTAWKTDNRPEQVTMIGDPQEGQIVLPSAELKTKYS